MKSNRAALTGAAFLMATSAVGPGFLTQTTVFTQRLLSSFGFVILVSVLLDIIIQLNIWRIIAVSGKRAQELANAVFPGMGYLLAILIIAGGLVFNIGNIAGAGLGVGAMTGVSVQTGAVVSAAIAILIFLLKEAGPAIDMFSKALGVVMIVLIIWVAVSASPPLGDALHHSFIPVTIDTAAIITLVGGTVGGYISFAGAHRLLDAGIAGSGALQQVNRGAVTGILITGVIRILLFLAALGVVSAGVDTENPASTLFLYAAGKAGRSLFGLLMWSAAITSVVGAAYTSVSFIRSFHPWLEQFQRQIIVGFILFSTIIFIIVGKPVKLLLFAGMANGIVLPIALALMLLATHRPVLMKGYRHADWLRVTGWLVVGLLAYMSVRTLVG
jgi:Mn2+/Fe2+ NRAMP family transporter